MASQRSPEDERLVSKVLVDFEEDLKHHTRFVEAVDRRYRAYRAVLERGSQADSWTNKSRPHIALQSVETMVANLIDPAPKWRLRAKPLLGTDPADVQRLRDGARANELLLAHQLSLDKYAEKQRPFDLQALIAGTTASKQMWLERTGTRRFQEQVEEPVYGPFGDLIGTVPQLRTTTKEVTFRDDPTTEVVDVRDLVLPENATSMAKLPRLAHVMWMTFDELKTLEANGVYGVKAGGEPVDQLKDGQDFQSELHNREQELFGVKRTKGLIKVVEHYIDGADRIVTIANHRVLLRNKRNELWLDHLDHKFPFVICSGMPDLFRIPGISEVELMQELQEMLWSLMNQRLDSLQLLSNAIFLIADDVDDPDQFEFAPGERWLVPRPVQETVQPWHPDPQVPRMTLEAEALIRGDVQNVTGGMPFLSGTDSQNIDQDTATGVSIVTSLAQKRLAAKKQQFVWAKARIGEQWCALNQQFIRSPRLVPVIGHGGVEAFEEIRPELIQGVFLFETEMVDDSMMRSERRAEAQAKLQVAVDAVGVFAQLSQATGGQIPALNLRAFMDDYLDAFDISDKDRYYMPLPVNPAGLGQGQPAPGAGPEAAAGNGGVTNAALAAGPSSPSNDQSMSPAAAEQRMRAMTGGAVNR